MATENIGDGCVKQHMVEKPSGGGGRIAYIDSLKGFAILCVVMGHVLDGYLKANIALTARQFMERLIDVINAFHMPLFMMISGYVFTLAYFDELGKPRKKRIYQQMGNLFVIYTLFAVAFGLCKIITTRLVGNVNNEISLMDILLIWVKPYAPYWYIYVLIVFYVFFSIEKVHAVNRYFILVTLVIFAVLSSFVGIRWLAISSVLYYSLFFYIGILLSRCQLRLIESFGMTLGMLCTTVGLCVAVMHYTHSNVNMWISKIPVVNIIVGIGISLALWYSFKHIKILSTNPILTFLGRSSLEIYVIHCFFTAGFRIMFSKIGLTDPYISIFLNFFLSTTIPIIFALICKQIGIYGFLVKPLTTISINKAKKQQ